MWYATEISPFKLRLFMSTNSTESLIGTLKFPEPAEVYLSQIVLFFIVSLPEFIPRAFWLISFSLNQNSNRQHLYDCAMIGESTVEAFNSRTYYTFPVRNEKQKAVFVVELVSREQPEATKRSVTELDLLETVIYVLDMCQKELLEEMLKGNSDKQFGKLVGSLILLQSILIKSNAIKILLCRL